jgi:hypothetical protein
MFENLITFVSNDVNGQEAKGDDHRQKVIC